MIEGDSSEYDLITKEINKLKFEDVVLTCEIGLRKGLGSKIIMDAVLAKGVANYRHLAVDPYGNLNYKHYDDMPAYTADYTDEMKVHTMQELHKYKEFAFFEFPDEYFFETMGDGYPFSIEGKTFLFGQYAVVHLDAPHTSMAVQKEVDFFVKRMAKNSLIIIDDYKTMNLKTVRWFLEGKMKYEPVVEGESKLIFKRVLD